MTTHELKRRFPKASAAFIAANSADVEVSDTEQRQCEVALEADSKREAQGAGCPLVRFRLCRVKLLDVDAKYASVKDLLDGLSNAGLIHGDKEGQVRLEVEQEKVSAYESEQTVIEIHI